MKEIKAYVRRECISKVISLLEENNVAGLTVIDVNAVGPNLVNPDASTTKWSMNLVERSAKLSKLELITTDDQVDKLVNVIRKAGNTRQRGDGIIIVSSVESALKIRSGKTDENAII